MTCLPLLAASADFVVVLAAVAAAVAAVSVADTFVHEHRRHWRLCKRLVETCIFRPWYTIVQTYLRLVRMAKDKHGIGVIRESVP